MSLSPFDGALGVLSGRIEPTTIAVPAGDYVFCLGSDVAGRFFALTPGDHVTVAQTADWADEGTLLRARVLIRPPAAMPAGKRWRFSVRVAGVELVAHDILEGGRPLDLRDVAINLNSLAASFEVAFRLELAGVGDAELVELPGVFVDAITFEG